MVLHMNRLATALATLMIVTAATVVTVTMAQEDPRPPMAFGMDAGSLHWQESAGVKAEYGTFWVGPWTLKHGWGGPDQQLDAMRKAGVTPAIHFYYWGDDISQSCIENGCYSSLHQAQKDRAGWDRLATQLADRLNARMQGAPVVILMETEFNKADVQRYEPLDGYLAEKADFLHSRYPNAQIVLSLGNWNTPAWSTWDRAAAASDYIGLQGMRGSTRDSSSHYDNLYEDTLSGAQYAKQLFKRPVFLQDLALSSYPEPEYVSRQASELQQFFTGMNALKDAGVVAMIYRSWINSDHMDLANYYGQAERHWGLAYSDGTRKPSADVWIDGVKAERSGQRLPFLATFQVSSGVNEWWVETRVESSRTPVAVAASHNGGPWVELQRTSWGSWARSFNAPAGGTMAFRATDAEGQYAFGEVRWLNRAPVAQFTQSTNALEVTLNASGSSDPDGDALNFSWALGDGNRATGVALKYTYAKAGTYNVQLIVDDGRLKSETTKAVTVRGPNAPPTPQFSYTVDGMRVVLDARASSDADGDPLSYSWSLGDGRNAQGAVVTTTYAKPGDYQVVLAVSDGKASSSLVRVVPVKAPMTATFTPSGGVNEWWVDVRVEASNPPVSVEARTGNGAWVPLKKTSWGTWAASFHAPAGSTVSFRATDAYAQVATGQQIWLANTPLVAKFIPKTQDNRWWVEVTVESSQAITKVDMRRDGGAWTPMEKTKWGTWSKGMDARGSVEFRAYSQDGRQATSGAFRWG
jgi:PKD repeat protein